MTADTAAPSVREALEAFMENAPENYYADKSKDWTIPDYCPHCSPRSEHHLEKHDSDCPYVMARLALVTPPAPTPSAARERIALAQRALRYIADTDRPANWRGAFGAEQLHQIADGLALLPDAAAIRAAAFEPTDAQINSACLSFRHDYGLLDDHDRERLRFVAIEWLRAWQKEGFGCDRDEVIERCAAVVDQCNREGPYEAIASAKRIRALKSAAIRAAGER